jgi:hypothetical protein
VKTEVLMSKLPTQKKFSDMPKQDILFASTGETDSAEIFLL